MPEASDYISTSADESVSLVQPTTSSPFVQGLIASAREHSLPINVGIHEPCTTSPSSSSSSRRIRNTLIWIDSAGNIAHRYQKLHVFDIDLRETGGPVLKESDSTEPGSQIIAPYEIQTKSDNSASASASTFGQIGSLICFDLRFPEPSLSLRRQGAKTLLYPSAFTVPTGKQHWEVLLRARAIENQCFVIAAAQCGRHNARRVSYGDSMVVGPNGDVKGRLDRVENIEEEQGMEEHGRNPELLLVDLDFAEVDKVRRGIPLLRRTDVYTEY